jgi:hypothetical protein
LAGSRTGRGGREIPARVSTFETVEWPKPVAPATSRGPPAGLTAALTERLGELGRELVLSALAELRAGEREAAATMLTELVGR